MGMSVAPNPSTTLTSLISTQVDFTPHSPRDPLSFSRRKKWLITWIGFTFSIATNWNTGAYAIGERSLQRDLGGTALRTSAGFGLYVWGFAIFPLILSGVSEDLGRKPMYVVTGVLYWLFFFPIIKYVPRSPAVSPLADRPQSTQHVHAPRIPLPPRRNGIHRLLSRRRYPLGPLDHP